MEEVKGHNRVGGIYIIFIIWREWSGDRLCDVKWRWSVLSGTKSLEIIQQVITTELSLLMKFDICSSQQ